jgi:acetylornithine deacetylase
LVAAGNKLTGRQILEVLIGFDTTSARSNLALIDWIANYLADFGIHSDLTYSDDRSKANLFATIGPDEVGGIVLSGHTDVVPVDNQIWLSDPFKLVERDGRLYGRGTADMKTFIALALASVPEFQLRAKRQPVHIALSYDEELGCLGVHRLVAALPAGERKPCMVIVGEPTSMRVVNAHKGSFVFETRVKGYPGHSSVPKNGVNAIIGAAEIITEISRMSQAREASQSDKRFDVPYTTFSVGGISGGTAPNIIAGDCKFDWGFRPIPAEDPAAVLAEVEGFVRDRLLPRMQATHPATDVVTVPVVSVVGLDAEPHGAAETLCCSLTGEKTSSAVAFGTEAGIFQNAGCSAVVCGPGSILQAHQADEFIALEQVVLAAQFFDKLSNWLSR